MSIELQFNVNNRILVSHLVFESSFFLLSYVSHGFVASLIIQQLIDCFRTLFLDSCGTQARLLGVT
jgi:ABC-type bacteriocin/lantibiotic exporter with double-glycine peptidase domain